MEGRGPSHARGRHMCECCHQECCCRHGHRGWRRFPPPDYPVRWAAYEEPALTSRREYLEEEKAALEHRLKALDERLREWGK